MHVEIASAITDLEAVIDRLKEALRRHNTSVSLSHTSAIDEIAAAMREGLDEARAIETCADAWGADRSALTYLWRLHHQRQGGRSGRMMEIRVADLTAAGLKDDEIARILGLHERSVPRIRRRMRERANREKG